MLFCSSHPSACLQGQADSNSGLQEVNGELLLGTLDLYAVKALPGEILIGQASGSLQPLLQLLDYNNKVVPLQKREQARP